MGCTMKRFLGFLATLLLIIISYNTLLASDPLKNRYSVDFHFGGWRGSSSSSFWTTQNGASVKADASGMNFGLSFNHWIEENLSAHLHFGFLGANAEIQSSPLSSSVSSNIIMPVFVGVKYYFVDTSTLSGFRPYGGLSLGPIFGFESMVERFSVEGQSTTSAAGRISGGVDLLLGRVLKLNISGGYTLMLDFSHAVGGRKNYGGADILVGFGFLFGKGVQ